MTNGKTSNKSFSTYEEKRPRTPLGPYEESGRGKTCQIRLPMAFRGHIRSYLLEELIIIPLYTLYVQSLYFDEYEKWKNHAIKYSFIKESDAHRLWYFFRTQYWIDVVNNDEKVKQL